MVRCRLASYVDRLRCAALEYTCRLMMMMACTCLGMGTSRHPPDTSSRSFSVIFVFSLHHHRALASSSGTRNGSYMVAARAVCCLFHRR
jgi:hypothetical protein